MFKFAFLINVTGIDTKTYHTVYETEESYNIVAGVNGVEAGRKYAAKLVKQGIEVINLCGDFDDEITALIQQDAGEGVKVSHASYNLNELAKLNTLKSYRNYGVIIKADGTEKPHEVVLRSRQCDTRIIFVNDMPQARRAARRLVEKRTNFIELCSWFDILRLENLVVCIDGEVPIGTCAQIW